MFSNKENFAKETLKQQAHNDQQEAYWTEFLKDKQNMLGLLSVVNRVDEIRKDLKTQSPDHVGTYISNLNNYELDIVLIMAECYFGMLQNKLFQEGVYTYKDQTNEEETKE